MLPVSGQFAQTMHAAVGPQSPMQSASFVQAKHSSWCMQ
jgi:hypothetical protein